MPLAGLRPCYRIFLASSTQIGSLLRPQTLTASAASRSAVVRSPWLAANQGDRTTAQREAAEAAAVCGRSSDPICVADAKKIR